MEEVDKIILPILRQTGCNLPDEIQSVAQFESQHVYAATANILMAIQPEFKINTSLPAGKAARYRVCTTLSTAILKMGFTDKLGYEAFLYPNEADTRKLLIWLVDKLPKHDDAEGNEDDVLGAPSLQGSIQNALTSWASQTWTPLGAAAAASLADKVAPPTRLSTVRLAAPLAKDADEGDIGGDSEARADYVRRLQPVLSMQPASASQFAPSLFEMNSKRLIAAAEREREWAAAQGGAESGFGTKAERAARLADMLRGAFSAGVARQQRGLSSAAAEMAALLAGEGAYGIGSGADGENGAHGDASAFARRAEFAQEKGGAGAVVVGEHGTVTTVTEEGELEQEREERERELQEAREAEMAKLNAALAKLQEKRRRMAALQEENISAARRNEAEIASVQAQTKKIKAAYTVKKKTLDLLPNASENLRKLREISQASAANLLNLGKEWEQHRQPLLAKYRRKRQQIAERKDEVGIKVDQIKRMRREMKAKAQEIRQKDVLYKQVLDEFNRMPKSINRQVYVQRIMDIMANIDRQKQDIAKILDDVRRVQKDINATSKSSKRSFDIADEVVYQTATLDKDPCATQAYRNIVSMRDNFVELVQSVEANGKLNNDIRDLQAQIETLEARNTKENMSRVKADLEAVKEENKALKKQIKRLRRGGGGGAGGD